MDTAHKAGILTGLLWTGTTRFTAVFVIAGILWGGLPAHAQEAEQKEKDERRALLETVIKLQLENQALKRRVTLLETQLAGRTGDTEERLSKESQQILDYNAELKMVILNSGAWHEMKPGMRLAGAARRKTRSTACCDRSTRVTQWSACRRFE